MISFSPGKKCWALISKTMLRNLDAVAVVAWWMCEWEFRSWQIYLCAHLSCCNNFLLLISSSPAKKSWALILKTMSRSRDAIAIMYVMNGMYQWEFETWQICLCAKSACCNKFLLTMISSAKKSWAFIKAMLRNSMQLLRDECMNESSGHGRLVCVQICELRRFLVDDIFFAS